MSLRDSILRALRSLQNAKARTAFTSLAVAVGAFALTLTLSASNGANNYADTIIRTNFDPSELLVSKSDDLFRTTNASAPSEYTENTTSVTSGFGATSQIESLSDQDVATLQAVPGVASVRTNTTKAISYVTRDGKRKYSATVQAYTNYRHLDVSAGSVSSPLDDTAVILPEAFLAVFGFTSPSDAVGKTIRLAVQKQPDQSTLLSALSSNGAANPLAALNTSPQIVETNFTIVAVSKKPAVAIQPGSALFITISPEAVTKLSDISTKGTANYHKYLSVTAKVTDGTNPQQLRTVQDRIKKLGYGAQSVADTEQTITQVISVLQGIVLVFGLIAVVASVFGIINTMYISVLQRTREIGLMKALGMHKASIARLFLLEAGLLGLLGGLLGSSGAVIVGLALNPTLSRLLGIGNEQLLDFHVGQIAILLFVLTVIAMLAGLFPARRAARLDPIEALRTE